MIPNSDNESPCYLQIFLRGRERPIVFHNSEIARENNRLLREAIGEQKRWVDLEGERDSLRYNGYTIEVNEIQYTYSWIP